VTGGDFGYGAAYLFWTGRRSGGVDCMPVTSEGVSEVARTQQATFLGHPVGLFVLFFTEMWERFSYYGMRALLVLYMVNYFKWSQEDASGVYKWYASLVYLTPLLGGYLADRYLGNKWAIIIGATLMAIGHFCMAFEQLPIFYAALIFLIIGNGFFKPNMSTQVGRLYPANDDRRDAAYTIFYMGINLGAFLSPIMCGALAEGTRWGYHAGFTLAGVGMVLGLITYLLGLRWVEELPDDALAEEAEVSQPETVPEPEQETKAQHKVESHYMTEREATTTPSVIPGIAKIAPAALWLLGGLAIVVAVLGYVLEQMKWDDAIALGLGGSFAAWMAAWITSKISMAVRDRVLAILVLAVFVVFFWAAFEQAGNAMNVFADKVTNRYVTAEAPAPTLYPEVETEAVTGSVWDEIAGAFVSLANFNPMPAATFQSINPLAIFILAPLFAWLWTWLPRHGVDLSIPVKMSLGVALQAVAFALMFWSISFENQPSKAPLDALPPGVIADAKNRVVFRPVPDISANDEAFAEFGTPPEDVAEYEVVHGGRLIFGMTEGQLDMTGVLADTDRDRMLRASVSDAYLLKVRALAEASQAAAQASPPALPVSVELDRVPAGFDMRYAGFSEDEVTYDAATQTLTAKVALADKDYKMLLLAGADAGFRKALNELYVTSAQFKISVWWLFWFYILCTVGELCLSPVGLSMVSKLAPARFATMLMGLWLLTSFFGNYAAGLAGESWGTVHPATFFGLVAVVVFVASLICFAVSQKVVAMMHGAK
jgi:POT family proton-dependent oligopeptide transporter